MHNIRLAIVDRPGSPESSINDEIMILDTPEGPKKVLEEEEYLDRMTNIIRRDFFPNIQFSNEDGSTPKTVTTPSGTLDTPGTQISTTSSMRSRREATSLSLNDYFDKYTSEDNAYFERLQRREKKRHQRKYPWLYQNSKTHNKDVKTQLALPSSDQESSSKDQSMEKKMIYWPYNPKNSLFYPPKDTKSIKSQSVINYNSSKFVHDPDFKRPLPPTSINYKSKSINSNVFSASNKIGVDGKLTDCDVDSTPLINGFSFVPEPESPIMSKSGLLNADAAESNEQAKQSTNSRGKHYTICQSPRDELAYKLYENRVGKFIRTPKRLKHGGSDSSTPGSSRRSTGTPAKGYEKGIMDFDFSPGRVKTPLSKSRITRK